VALDRRGGTRDRGEALMLALRGYLIVGAVALLVGAGGGLGLAYHLWVKPAPVETAQPAVRQKDSSLVLARVPDAKAKSPVIIPKGETLARVVEAAVQPSTPIIVHDTVEVPATTGATLAHEIVHDVAVQCPPVRVVLTMTDLTDGTHRVIASSPDGRVIEGSDIVVKNTAPVRVLKWSTGPMWGGGDNGFGANLTRDLGPARIIGAAMLAPARGIVPTHTVGLLAVNIRF
jgi:hypothetical protein